MSKFYQSIAEFFGPQTRTYHFAGSNMAFKKVLESLLDEKSNYLVNSDFEGLYIGDSEFSIGLKSSGMFANGIRFSSILNGKLSEKDGNTIIEAITRTSFALFAVFLFTVLCGILYLVKFTANGANVSYLIAGIAMVITGPAFSIWYAAVAKYTIYERFKLFLKKHDSKV